MEATSDMEDQSINILQLPDEILRNIFKFVPHHANLSLVCSKFYEISSQSKYFRITTDMLLDFEYDFENLVENSRRRFNSAYLSDCSMDYRLFLGQEHIDLLKLVGKDVKILRIFELEIDSNLRSLLKLLPNLEQILLEGEVLFLKPDPEHRTLLNLPKLEELSINCYEHSDINYVEMFNYLPNDVLRKIDVTCYRRHCLRSAQADFSKLFSSQRRLEEISICSCLFPWIDSNALNSVTKANVTIVSLGDNLEPIFKGLKSVEVLHLVLFNYVSSDQAISLSKLQNLKTLSINWSRPEIYLGCLNGLSSSSLKKLCISFMSQSVITAPTLIALSRNLPQLEYLGLGTESPIEIINTIIDHFSKLKILYFVASNGQYVFQDNLVNENLTSLIIKDFGSFMSDDIPKLLAACKNLNCFETNMGFKAADLEAILKYQPKLTRLCLKYRLDLLSTQFIEKFKETLEMFGQNLREFFLNFTKLGSEVTEKLLQTAFANNFKNIKLSREWHCGIQRHYTLKMNN